MDSKTQEVFTLLQSQPDNKVCFECEQPSNQWSSVNNGIFLCLDCCGLHRGFGVNVSFVRSIGMDSWTDLQLSLMKAGGNAKLKQFFQKYSMPKDAPMDFKYRTKAGIYYREMLKAAAEGKEPGEAPSDIEGLELVGNLAPPVNFKSNVQQGFGSTPQQEESSGFSLDKVKNVATQLYQNTKEKTANIYQETKTMGKNALDKVSEKVHDPEFQGKVKNVGSTIAEKTKSGANIVYEKSKNLASELPGLAKTGVGALKKGWGSAMSYITGKKAEEKPEENAEENPDSYYAPPSKSNEQEESKSNGGYQELNKPQDNNNKNNDKVKSGANDWSSDY